MPTTGYPVPASEASAELRFKNSVFTGIASYADSVGAARAVLDDIRTRFADASHCVYAFAIGHGASTTHGMSDDGEPPGTAGRPVLAVVKGSGLGDVVVAVVRYFGGTKLGTGGLVRAYTAAAQAVLAEVDVVTRIAYVTVTLRGMPYEFFEAMRSALLGVEGRIDSEEFSDRVTLRADVPDGRLAELEGLVRDASSGRIRLEVTTAEGR